jgi:hypothetical protein
MILLDYSEFVCEWLDGYLAGKGEFETHWLEHPKFTVVSDRCVDFALAYGVFEHVELDDICLLAKDVGFEVSQLERNENRSVWMTLHKR